MAAREGEDVPQMPALTKLLSLAGKHLAPLVLLALLAAFLVFARPFPQLVRALPSTDHVTYIRLAQSLRTGHYQVGTGIPYYDRHNTAFPPTYPLMLALTPCRALTKATCVGVSIGMFFLALGLLYLLALRTSGVTGATLAAGLLVALLLYRQAAGIGRYLIAPMSEMACYTFVLAAFYARRPVVKGVCIALAGLARPEALVLAVPLLLLERGWPRRAVLTVAALVVCAPYLVFCRVNTGHWCLTEKTRFNSRVSPYLLAGFTFDTLYGRFDRPAVFFPPPSSLEARARLQGLGYLLSDAIRYESMTARVGHNLGVLGKQLPKYWPYLLLGLPALAWSAFRKRAPGLLALGLLAISPLWLLYFYQGDRFFLPLLLACCLAAAEWPPMLQAVDKRVSWSARLRHWSSARSGWLAAGAITIIAIVSLALAYRHAMLLDDTFISLVYVKNLLHGHGLTWNGTRVQGFTHPLWVLLLAALGTLGVGLPAAAGGLGLVSGAGALLAAYWLGRRLGLARPWAVAGLAALGLSLDFVIYAGSGLETPLFAGLLLALAGVLAPSPLRGRTALAGLASGLLALCRPEGFALIPIAAAVVWRREGRRGALLCLGVAVLLATPWLIWARLFYGDWLPNPYYAKAGALSLASARWGLDYLFLGHPWPSRLGLALTLAALCLIALRPPAPGLRGLALGCLGWMGYVLLVGGDFMAGLRFLVPVWGPMLVVLLATAQARRSLAPAMLGIVLLLTAARWLDPRPALKLRFERAMHQSETELARYLKATAPPDALVAVNAAGVLPYYSGLPCLDMVGINDRHIARHGHRNPALMPGHQCGDGDYVLDRRPTHLLLMPGPGVFVPLISDLEIKADPRLEQEYERVPVRLPSGRTVPIYRRRDAH